MQSGLRKDFPELLFRALALHRSKTLLLVRCVGSSNMGQHRLLRSSSFGSALMFLLSDLDIAPTMLEKLIPLEFRKEHKSQYRWSNWQRFKMLFCHSVADWHVSIHVQQHSMINLRKRARLRICSFKTMIPTFNIQLMNGPLLISVILILEHCMRLTIRFN